MNLNAMVRTAKTVITANSPALLVVAAVTGIVTTGITAAKAGYKARGIIDEAKADAGVDELPLGDKVKLTWLCYAVPAVTGASSIASVLGVHTIHTKRHAAMMGLYAVATTKLDDVQEKAEEMLGSKKAQQLRNEVAQKAVDRNPVTDHEVVILEGGTELMYDEWSGRYMMGNIGIVETAIANVNILMASNGEAALNDFYDYVGLSSIPMGLKFGWVGDAKLTVSFGSVKTNDGRAAVSFYVNQPPTDVFGRH